MSTREEGDSILEYVTKVREWMEAAWEIVKKNMEQAQAFKKEWYDKRAREIKLNQGDRVLVLHVLPTSTHKFEACWHGPYLVKRAAGKVNYEVVMPERRKPNVIFHINMLKKWHEADELNPVGNKMGTVFHTKETEKLDEPDIY